jgi:hypothetical protein
VVKSHLQKKTVKKINDIRWSARADAILALKECYDELKNDVLDIAAENEKPLAKAGAKSSAKKFEKCENAVPTVFWNLLLQRLLANL